jgi:hypothetical protein
VAYFFQISLYPLKFLLLFSVKTELLIKILKCLINYRK